MRGRCVFRRYVRQPAGFLKANVIVIEVIPVGILPDGYAVGVVVIQAYPFNCCSVMSLQEKYFVYSRRAFDVDAIKGTIITWLCRAID